MSAAPSLPSYAPASIHQFLRAHARGPGVYGVIVGLSGGVDSALAARLARDSLGAERVMGLLLPDRRYPKALEEETCEYARSLGIRSRTVRLERIEEAFQATLPEVTDRLAQGNIVARIRMTILYAVAREEHLRVMGTGNKSEILLGYFTKFGDGGADLLPLGDLYKSQVYELARGLGLPASVLDRAPSAGLWEGQTDEAELGLPYRDLDRILRGIEELRSESEIAERTGVPVDRVKDVIRRVAANRHKRVATPIPKLGLRTIGIDWKD
ncbi:MAG: NAD+ synthase [Thermoplasmata archaeon]|nr:NAD+ synthase [Thermoplasmata archaeon]